MKNLHHYIIGLLFAATTHSLKAQVPNECTDVMLQAFYWNSFSDSNWKNLRKQACEISQYFDLVWLPPSGNAANSKSMGYLPIYYFNQTSGFGPESDLRSLINLFKENNTHVIADIVINHRNGRYTWTDFPSESYKGISYTWGPETICQSDECVNNGYLATGAPDTGENYSAARDIDHTNEKVRKTIIAYMRFLKNDIGYDGWRYDYTKGYKGMYNTIYNDSANAYFSVGECWDGSYNVCYNWLVSAEFKSTTFDFPLKYAINNAFNGSNLSKLVTNNGTENQPSGLLNKSQSKKYSVTFIENHDTGVSGNSAEFKGDVLAANAFILCSPGIPCIYMKHWQKYKDKLKLLINARKSAGIHSNSTIVINETSSNSYIATCNGKIGKLILKIGNSSYPNPSSEYSLVIKEDNFTVWSNVALLTFPEISAFPQSGTFKQGTVVTLTATNQADIYFTIDGSAPNQHSTKYTSPIEIKENTVLKAIAVDKNGNSSNICHEKYITTLNPIQVGFKAPESWSTVAIYAWENISTPLAGSWPGTVINKDKNGFFTFIINNQTEEVINRHYFD